MGTKLNKKNEKRKNIHRIITSFMYAKLRLGIGKTEEVLYTH
ncbi:hypothetical protein PMEL1_00896 [Prevotella melaninogenica]|uniref:Uncharacterized protein n=1 Tax=Prevotella melaninogenica TaxID=28132 RepID=A0A250KHA6_9BACT|nr:hypothetical protein PMEL1_00896 [Prevotella melaninogenica]